MSKKTKEVEGKVHDYLNGRIKFSFEEAKDLKEYIRDNKKFGFWYDIKSFILLMKYLVAPQSYGSRVPEYIKDTIGLNILTKSGGDAMFNDKVTEIKTSISAGKDKKLNYQQLRSFEKEVKQYLLLSFYINDNLELDIYAFLFTKDEMDNEKSSSCHISKEAKAAHNNSPEERGVKLKIGSERFKKWCKNYNNIEIVRKISSINKILDKNL